ncbi:hypothetical protein Trydic_g14130 [Trypoxylus dichotomus]
MVFYDLTNETVRVTLMSCYTTKDNSTYYFDEKELVGVTFTQIKIAKTMLFLGYALSQIIGGVCADLYGGRYIMMFTNLVVSVCMIIYPLLVVLMPWYVMVSVYLLIGLLQGITHPCRFSILSRWVPEYQLTLLGGTLQAGGIAGKIVRMYLRYYFINSDATTKFFYAFMFWGFVGCFLFAVTLLFVYPSPFQCKFATKRERDDMDVIGSKRPKKIRWKQIFRDEAIWATIVQQIGHGWLSYILNDEVAKMFAVSDKEDFYWQVSVLLWTTFIVLVVSCAIINKLVNQKRIPTIHLRILCIVTGDLLASVPIILLHYMKGSRRVMVVIRFAAFFLKGVHYAGGQVNLLDLTRYYTGTVIAVQYTVCDLVGYFMHTIAVMLGQSKSTEAVVSWSGLDDLTFGVNMITVLLYLIWARAERADWDVIVEEEEEFVDELSSRY